MKSFQIAMRAWSAYVDARPLAFVRISFGFLMIAYSANKCTDDLANKNADGVYFPFEYRIPTWLHKITQAFPYYTSSHLYWHLHGPLMLLSAAGIAMTFGPLSRLSCLVFSYLKLILTLQDQTIYNNHEYLYSLVALAFGLLGGHEARLSFLGQAAYLSYINDFKQLCVDEDGIDMTKKVSVGLKEVVNMGDCDCNTEEVGYTDIWRNLFLALGGTVYLLLNNAVYGIAGYIAIVGVVLGVWPGVVLLLGGTAAICCTKTPKAKEGGGACEEIKVPYWHVLFLRTFFSAVYVFAGFAKLNFDWLSGQTVTKLFQLWTGPSVPIEIRNAILNSGKGDSGIVGNAMVSILSYGGAVLDLVCGLLLNSTHGPTRACATALVACFHLANHTNFVIETFPWVMLSALAVHHDAQWMETMAILVHRLMTRALHVRTVMHACSSLLSHLLLPCMALFMTLHLLIPLPCALYSLTDDGSLVWGTQCSYFRWRMMTRSVEVLSAQLRFQDTKSGRVDNVPFTSIALYPDVAYARECTQQSPLERYGQERDTALNRFLQEAGSYEDRVAFLVEDALARITPSTSTVELKPKVFADVWISVNGPPYQRYIDPTVDLASPAARSFSSNATAEQSVFSVFQAIEAWWAKPVPLAAWVLPRLHEFRTSVWQERFRRLTQQVDSQHAQATAKRKEFGIPILPAPQTVFFADHHGKGFLRLLTDFSDDNAPVELMLLHGTADIVNLDVPTHLSAGACIKVLGHLSLHTVNSSHPQSQQGPSLWMVVSHRAVQLAHGAGRIIGDGGPLSGVDKTQPSFLSIGYANMQPEFRYDDTSFQYCFATA